MHIVHAMVAGAVGEISLALTRGSAPRGTILKWIKTFREAADKLEEMLGERPTNVG